MEDTRYRITVPGIKGQRVISADAFEKGKKEFFQDFPNAVVFEESDYSSEDAIDSNDLFRIEMPGTKEGAIVKNAQEISKMNVNGFLADYPDAKISRIRQYKPYQAAVTMEDIERLNQINAGLQEQGQRRDQASKEYARIDSSSLDFDDPNLYNTEQGRMYALQVQGAYGAKLDAENNINTLQQEKVKNPAYRARVDYGIKLGDGLQKQIKQGLLDTQAAGYAALDETAKTNPDLAIIQMGGNLFGATDPLTGMPTVQNKPRQIQTDIAAAGGQGEDYLNYKAAQSLTEDTLNVLRSDKKGEYEGMPYFGKFWAGTKNFGRGAASKLTSEAFWDSFAGMENGLQFAKLRDKILGITAEVDKNFKDVAAGDAEVEKLLDEKLTPSEKTLLDAYLFSAETADIAGDVHLSFNAGQSAAESAKMAVEFMLAGGVTGGAKSAVQKALYKRMLGRSLFKVAPKVVRPLSKALVADLGAAAAGAIQTAVSPTAMANAVTASSQVDWETGDAVSGVEAALKSYGTDFIENATEFGLGPTNKLMSGLGRTKFGKLFTYTPGVKTFMDRAGVQNIFEEWGEELNGAIIDRILGNENALKDFFTTDNQLTLLASFGPTIGSGAAVSAVQKTYYNLSWDSKWNSYKKTLKDYNVSDKQIAALENSLSGSTPEELASHASPMVKQLLLDFAGNPEVQRATLELIDAKAKQLAANGSEENDLEQRKADVLNQMQEQMGGKQFYTNTAHDVNGESYDTQSVDVVVDKEGNETFIVGESTDPAKMITIDANGKVGTIDKAQLRQNGVYDLGESDDALLGTRRQMRLSDYLRQKVVAGLRASEQARINQQYQQNLSALKASATLNSEVTVGPAEAQQVGHVVATSSEGVVVQFDAPVQVGENTEVVHNLTWQQYADLTGQPLAVEGENDEAYKQAHKLMRSEVRRRNANATIRGQKISDGRNTYTVDAVIRNVQVSNLQDDEIATIIAHDGVGRKSVMFVPYADIEQRQPAQEQAPVEAIAELDDGVQRDFRGNPLPLDSTGEVDTEKLWNDDPEAWAHYDAQQRGDFGASAAQGIDAAIAATQQTMTKDNASLATIPPGKQRDEVQARVQAAQNHINELRTIKNRVAHDMIDLQLKEKTSIFEQSYAQAQTLEEKVAIAKEYVQLLEGLTAEDIAAGAQMSTRIVTLDTIEQQLIADGMSEANARFYAGRVKKHASSGEAHDGFESLGHSYLFPEFIPDLDTIRSKFVHERDHAESRKDGSDVLAIASSDMTREQLEFAVRCLSHGTFYDGMSARDLANELVAYSMEVCYNGVDVEPILRAVGVSDTVINIIKNRYARQSNDKRLASAKRTVWGRSSEDLYSAYAGDILRYAGTLEAESGTVEGSRTGSDGRGGESSGGEEGTAAAASGDSAGAEPAQGVEPVLTPEESALSEQVNKSIGTAQSGEMQMGASDEETSDMHHSTVSIAQGAGFTVIPDNGSGDVAFELNGVRYTASKPISAQTLRQAENTVLNYLVADALRVGTVTEESVNTIYQRYADMLNRYLELGKAANGGVDALMDDFQWLGETVYKTVASNSDAQYSKSLDITRVCKKNEAVINAIAELQRRLGYGITPGQVLDIYWATNELGYQVPCPVCYVFSRYIRNGRYATIMINGQRKYGSKLVDPASLTPAQQKQKVKYWLSELAKVDQENKKHSKEIDKAKADITKNLLEIDDIARSLPSLSDKQRKAAKKKIQSLDKRYRTALDVVSQASLDSWITQFAIHKTKDGWQLYDDTYQGFPEEVALDLRQTAKAITLYPAVQRFRKSRGAAAGKEITFAANNDLGEVALDLGAMGTPNYYKMAVEAEDEQSRQGYLKEASKKFDKAHIYAQQQSLRGGQRMWSWSDNIERLAPDVFVNLMQLELLGGALQSYSKQLEGINLVARMGGYVNGSLMGEGIGYRELTIDEVEFQDGKPYHKGGDFVYDIPREDGVIERKTMKAPVFKENGKYYTLVFDKVVGIDPFGEPAADGHHLKGLFELNATLDKAGNILVGMNDVHVRTAMADDRVFFIIPWHSSGSSVHILRAMLGFLGVNLDNFNPQDYTNVQEEKHFTDKVPEAVIDFWEKHNYQDQFACGIEGGIASGENGSLSESQLHYRELRAAIFRGEAAEHMDEIMADAFLSQVYSNVQAMVDNQLMTSGDNTYIYPYEYWDEESTYQTADVNAARYMEYCRRMGFKPKFCGLLNGKAEGDFGNFVEDKGYWKLLIDRRMYDVNGNFQGLTPVSSEGFNPDLVDPAKTAQEFHVTLVADEAGTQKITDKVMAIEAQRTGSIPMVDYDTNLQKALEKFVKATAEDMKFSTTPQTRAEVEKIVAESFFNGTYMKAPNGAPTHLDAEQWAMVRTQAFKDWFGDWENDPVNASRMLDENGEPKVFYHGTPNNFQMFDPDWGTLGNELGRGVYFASSRALAEQYTRENGDNTYLVDRWIDNYLEDHDMPANSEQWKELTKMASEEAFRNAHVIPVFLNIRYPYDVTLDDTSSENMSETIMGKMEGHDGVVDKTFADRYPSFVPEGDYQVLAIDPVQIKSAVDFDGDFSKVETPNLQEIERQRQKIAGGDFLTEEDFGEDMMFSVSRNTRNTITSWVEKYWSKVAPAQMDESIRERWDANVRKSVELVLSEADKFADATTQLAYAKWFTTGSIRTNGEDDLKVIQAVKMAKNHRIDPLSYKSPMEIINLWGDSFKGKPINPDDVPTLHKASELPDGIVVYDVDDSDQSRYNMRQIINTHYGPDCSPWCLLQGDGKGNLTSESKRYWEHYNAYPKQVAFRNGKLLAFSANSRSAVAWWDRQDESHEGIPVEGRIAGDALGRLGTTIYYNNGNVGYYNIHKGSKGPNGRVVEWASINSPSPDAVITYDHDGNMEFLLRLSNGRPWRLIRKNTDGKSEILTWEGDQLQSWEIPDKSGQRLTTYSWNEHNGLPVMYEDNAEESAITIIWRSNGSVEELRYRRPGSQRYEKFHFDLNNNLQGYTGLQGQFVFLHEGKPVFMSGYGSYLAPSRPDMAPIVAQMKNDLENAQLTEDEKKSYWDLISYVDLLASRIDTVNPERLGDTFDVHLPEVSLNVSDYFNFDTYKLDAQRYLGVPEDMREYLSEDLRNEVLAAEMSAEERHEESMNFSVVRDQQTIDMLNSQPTVEAYHAMQMVTLPDGRRYLLPPMAAVQGGEYVEGIPVNEDGTITPIWEQADERQDLAFMYTKGKRGKRVPADAELQTRDGKLYYDGKEVSGEVNKETGTWEPNWYFSLKKGNKGDSGAKLTDLEKVAFDPYQHSGITPINDQFTTAYDRSHLVMVKVRVPASEASGESGYKADKAKLGVGTHPWKGGVLKTKAPRQVILSRYDMPVEILSDGAVAQEWKKMLDENGLKEVPFNIVTPGVRDALQRLGVTITEPSKGNAGEAAMDAYKQWKENGEEVHFSVSREQRQDAANLYDSILKNGFNDVSLRLLNEYIDNAEAGTYTLTARLRNPIGRVSLEKSTRTQRVDAVIGRIAEATVPKAYRAQPRGRQQLELTKKELLKQWAIATGNWYTDFSEFIGDSEPFDSGTDALVFRSVEGTSVVKLSKGKPMDKKSRADIDNVPLFNYYFPETAYDILGYGELDGNFVTILQQPVVLFAEDPILSQDVKDSFMASRGWKKISDTAYEDNGVVVSDLWGKNIVRNAFDGINVIDADFKLKTPAYNGTYELPDVEKDFEGFANAKDFQTAFVENNSLRNPSESAMYLAQNPDLHFSVTPEVRAEMNAIIEAARADGTYMKAHNGKRSKLNEEQWALVRTAAFKEWFGDWEHDSQNASQVTDENGDPMVVYKSHKPGEVAAGYFTTDAGFADHFAAPGWILDEFFLNMRNPYEEDFHGADSDGGTGSDGKWRSTVHAQKWAIEEAREKGLPEYDGFILTNVDEYGYGSEYALSDDYIVRNPRNVKSALTNNGDFNPDDTRFNYSTTPEQNADSDDMRYSFVGEAGFGNNATLDSMAKMADLETAKQMEASLNPDWKAQSNEAALRIKMATGWEKGVDGKWKYELPDVEMVDILDWMDSRKALTLKDIVTPESAEQLFAMYPGLADVRIKKSNKKRTLGSQSDEKNTIELSMYNVRLAFKNVEFALSYGEPTAFSERAKDDFLRYEKAVRSTLVHEIQHYIQGQEGFAHGGNENTLKKNVNEAYINSLIDGYNEMVRQFNALPQSARTASQRSAIENKLREVKAATRNIYVGYEGYRNLAGEVEARNVAARMDMTPEQRRASLAVDTEDKPRQTQDIRFSVVGERGLSQYQQYGRGGEEGIEIRRNLRKAKSMAANLSADFYTGDVNALRVKYATGWEKNITGDWVYELPDGDFLPGAVDKISSSRLTPITEVWDDSTLFEIYPQLRNIKVRYLTFKEQENEELGGYFSPDKQKIALRYQVFDEFMRKAMIHELQHAIQLIEGFAVGTNSSSDRYLNAVGEVEARNAARRYYMTPEQRRNSLLVHTEDIDREDQDMRFSVTPRTPEQTEAMFERAKEIFGTTRDFREAGYLLPDGTLLDFSEKRDGGQPGTRNLDHRAIGRAMEEIYDMQTDYLTNFVHDGAIRLMPESAGIHLAAMPTAKQKSVLRDFIYRYNGEVILEMDDAQGYSDAYAEYDERTSPTRVLNDIKAYIEKGVQPVGNMMFSVANSNQRVFISNAEQAVEALNMGKASGEQWIKAIQGRGGLKAGEDEWLGLSEWLKDQDKVSKEEVLNFIKENQIRIEEVKYHENGQWSEEELDSFYDELPRPVADFHSRIQDEHEALWDELGDWDAAYDAMAEKYGAAFEEAYDRNEQTPDEPLQWIYADSLLIFGGFKSEGENSTDAAINSSRLAYTTEGLTNKREIALTVPTIEPYNQNDEVHFGDAGQGRAVAWIRFGETYARSNEKRVAELQTLSDAESAKEGPDYDLISKYGEELTKLMTGARVLVLDEIQSRRHQDGREKGYRSPEYDEAAKAVHEARLELDANRRTLDEKYGRNNYSREDLTPEELSRWIELSSKFEKLSERKQSLKEGVPNAPFSKNWHELAFKRMLRLAAEEGFDKLAWTTGAQQAERYSLGNVAREINGAITVDGERLTIVHFHGGGQPLEMAHDETGKILSMRGPEEVTAQLANAENIADVIGRDKAAEILTVDKPGTANMKKFTGGDLVFNASGMQGFYDDILPRFADKYGKKWGVKTYDIELPALEESARTMHAIDITPEMKESVMNGQMMFSVTPEAQKEMDDIVAQAKADGTYMLAPNGAKSNLNAEQWAMVRTKNFRNFFGDWMKQIRINKLLNSKAIEIKPEDYSGYDIHDVASVKAWMKDNLRSDQYENFDTKDQVEVSRVGINEVTSHGTQSEEHMKSICAIPAMINNSIFIEEQPNTKGNDKFDSYRYYVCGLKIDGADYTAKIVVGVKNGRKYYDHRLSQIEKGTLIESLNGLSNSVANENAISDVKDSKLVSILQNNSSKVVDENGEPMVVYHGTPDYGFHIFDTRLTRNKGKDNVGSHFGSEEQALSFESPDKTYSVFLNLRNPYKEDLDFFADEYNNAYIEALINLDSASKKPETHELFQKLYDIYPQLKDVELDPVKIAEQFRDDEGLDNEVGEDGILRTKSLEEWAEHRNALAMLYRNMLETEGYDGVVYSNWYEGNTGSSKNFSYVALEPNQIKSATDNSGEFSSDNNDIRYSVTPEEESSDVRYSQAGRVDYTVRNAKTYDQIREAGLAYTLGDDVYSSMMMQIYNAAPADMVSAMNREAMHNKFDFVGQISARLAEIAANPTPSEAEAKLLDDAVSILRNTIGRMPNNDAKWMLYLNGIAGKHDLASEIQRADVADRLGFDPKSMEMKREQFNENAINDVDMHFSMSAADIYAASLGVNTALKEAHADMYESVRELIKAVEKTSGKPARPYEDVLLTLNQLSSKNFADKDRYIRDYLQPMWDVIRAAIAYYNSDNSQNPITLEDMQRYVMLKHGLERNEKFAKRDALAKWAAWYESMKEAIKENQTVKEAKLKAAQERLQTAQEEFDETQRLSGMSPKAEAKARQKIAMLEDAVKEAQYASTADQEKLDRDYENHKAAVERGTDAYYKENREKDYSGIMAQFYEQKADVVRIKGESRQHFLARKRNAKVPKYEKLHEAETEAMKIVRRIEADLYVFKEDVKHYNKMKGVSGAAKVTGETDLVDLLWEKINACTKETLRHQKASGVISKAQYDALSGMFEYYVPLRGFSEGQASDLYTYMTTSDSGFNNPILKAKGRVSKAENPFGMIASAAESAIQEDNKNVAKMALYYFVLNRGGNGLIETTDAFYSFEGKDANGKSIWVPHYPDLTGKYTAEQIEKAWDELEEQMQAKQAAGQPVRRGLAKIDLQNAVIKVGDEVVPEHIIKVKVNGKDVDMLINSNPRAAQAINGLLNSEVVKDNEWFKKFLMGWNRLMSSLATSLNPAFAIPNFIRDVQYAQVSTWVDHGAGFTMAMDKYIAKLLLPGRIFRLVAMEGGGKGLNIRKYCPELAGLYEEFVANGGPTGYTYLTNNKEYDKKLEKFMKTQSSRTRKALHNAFEMFNDIMESVELITRFAAYLAAKEQGMSIVEAVNAAKEVTLNFNRKGSGKAIGWDEAAQFAQSDNAVINFMQRSAVMLLSAPAALKPLVMFYNAAIQGLTKFFKMYGKAPAKMTAVCAFAMTMGAMNALTHALAGGDDDDEVNDYFNIPSFLRRKALCFGGWGDDKSKYVAMPIAQEIAPFYGLGDLLVTSMFSVGGKPKLYPNARPMAEIAKMFGEWLPFNVGEIVANEKGIAHGTMEAVFRGVAAASTPYSLITNRTFYGAPIHPENRFETEEQAGHGAKWQKVRPKTGKAFIEISKFLNKVSGGDDVVGGWFNVYPDDIQFLFDDIMGGTGKFVQQVITYASKKVAGSDIRTDEIPVVSRLMTDTMEKSHGSYYTEIFRWADQSLSLISDDVKKYRELYIDKDPVYSNAKSKANADIEALKGKHDKKSEKQRKAARGALQILNRIDPKLYIPAKRLKEPMMQVYLQLDTAMTGDYLPPQLDSLQKEIKKTVDPEKRKLLMEQRLILQKRFVEDLNKRLDALR